VKEKPGGDGKVQAPPETGEDLGTPAEPVEIVGHPSRQPGAPPGGPEAGSPGALQKAAGGLAPQAQETRSVTARAGESLPGAAPSVPARPGEGYPPRTLSGERPPLPPAASNGAPPRTIPPPIRPSGTLPPGMAPAALAQRPGPSTQPPRPGGGMQAAIRNLPQDTSVAPQPGAATGPRPATPTAKPAGGNGSPPAARTSNGTGPWRPLPGPALASPQRPAPARTVGRLAALAPDPEPASLRPAPPPPTTAHDLAPQRERSVKTPPATRGWRRAVRVVSFGVVSPRPGRAERRERELIAAARTPIATCRRVAIVSRKGGIGKTTTTLMLGHTFAHRRGDRVVALDANPDAGSLAYRVHRETDATVTQLLRAADRIGRYSDMRTFTSQSSTRLEVLASDDDPTISVALGDPEYSRVLDVLEHHYNLILMDTGTGILDSATQGILRMADQIVVCAAPGIDASRASSLTLDWLDEHGYHELVSDAVVVINQVRKDGGRELRSVSQHFARRCRAVVKVPWDPHLAEGLEVEVDDLKPATRNAYLNAAAAVARSFGFPSHRH